MSDTILGGDVTVFYLADARRKQVVWTGSATGTRSANELYSALQNLTDELLQMDDGTVMSAQTPTEYQVGRIDPGDAEPWFLDKTTAEHVTGGAIRTTGWTRVPGTDTGLVLIQVTGSTVVQADIGSIITHADADTGVIVDVVDGGTGEIWVRPLTSAAANNFDSAAGILTVTGSGNTATQNGASATGESLWAGAFGLGVIEAKTHLYVFQNGSQLVAYKGTDDWWADGLFDVLIPVLEVDVEVDEGFITVFARQYTKLYDESEIDLTAGGRNPIALATANDGNNDTGIRQFTGSAGTGGFVVGETIGDNAVEANATHRGILTAVAGTVGAPILTYYLIGDLSVFVVSDAITGYTSSSTCTAGAPANFGPALLVGVTATHASNETFDIDEDGTTENYSIVIDCNNEALVDVYEVMKFAVRRGESATGRTDGLEGQEYRGSDRRVVYIAETGTVNEGDTVTQLVSLATGVVVSHNRTDNIIILRNSRGTFDNSNNIEVTGSDFVSVSVAPVVIVPVKAAPFGTFAGGIFFCAPGVVLDNTLAADANNFQLIDDDGNTVLAPTKVTVTSGNTRQFDSLAIYRLTAVGGIIDKAEYTIDAAQPALGATIIKTDPVIDAEAPTTGRVVVVDVSAGIEHIYRYTARATDEFVLFEQAQVAMDAGSNPTTIVDAGAFTNVQVGDIIRNDTRSLFAYVDVRIDANSVTLDRSIAGQTTGDLYTVGRTVEAYTTSDTVYVPFILDEETVGTDGTPGSESTTVTFSTDIPVRARVRQAGLILPYEADGLITLTGFVATTIRTPDTIHT